MISKYYTNRPPQKIDKVLFDPQRHRVYKLERELIGTSIDTHTPLAKLRAIAAHACSKNSVKRPTIAVVSKPIRVFGWCSNYTHIFLNKSFHGDNLGILLHELAHYIAWQKFPDAECHGPEFMAYYALLLDQYKLLPRDCMDVLAKRYGVVIGECK